jgi:hypothetical protein
VGNLKYDGMTVDFEDRLLAHIEVVVVQKLRRQETFLLSWLEEEGVGGSRTGIWLHQAALLTFHFDTSEDIRIDRAWLEKLMSSANSTLGLFVRDSDGNTAHPSDVNLNA